MYFSPIHSIMDKKTIIQWNCCGLRANYNEILILMSLFSPSVICLQETFLKQSDNISFRDFNMFNYICPDGQRASGGTSVIVIDLFNETVLFNHRGGRSPPRLLNRQSS